MDDVLTTAQAEQIHGRSAVRHRIASGRWQRPTRGVVVTHAGPLTRDQHERVVLAACPPVSALSGLTAAARLGLRGFETDRVHVVLPSGARRPAPAAVVHWSTELGPSDVLERTPRMTTLERSIVDAASWAVSKEQARTFVIAAFQQRLTNVRRMRDALSRRGPCRFRAVIIQSILDAAGGIQSLPERDFDEARIAAGLPRPTRQQRVAAADGRYYLDAWWEGFNLAVEIHGIAHLAIEQWSQDLQRANELVIDGRRVLAFSSFAIRHQRDTVIDQLRRAVGPEAD